MIKWFFILSGMVVSWLLLKWFAPSLFASGFHVAGHFIPWAAMLCLGVLYLGSKLHSKSK